MSNTVITADALGKSYMIGHQQKESYSTLRDVLTNLPRKWLSRLRNPQYHTHENIEEFWALKDVNFEIKQGDRVGIIGRNGAGKSTLLKILSRITEPTTGKVKIAGCVASLLEVGTGFHPELTGRENIFLNGAILGMSKKDIKKKFDEIIDFAEVEKFLDTPVKRYSSGMYVRLAFSVAAHLEPEILIVDEVLSVGDTSFQKKCLGKMDDVSKKGRTVLFVSHNMGAINRLCDKCFLLDKGKMLYQGNTEETIRRYLSEGQKCRSVFELKPDPNKVMNLRKVVLNPESDDRTGEVRYDKPIVIRIEYEIYEDVHNCSVWGAIQTSDGVFVFATGDYDMRPDLLGRRKAGYYISEFYVQEKWLNVGEYTVIVGLVQNSPVIVYHREDTISFSVIEVGTPASILQTGVRRGVLQPFIKWSVSRAEGDE